MNIYRISTDFSFKNVSAKEGVTKRFYLYQGQRLSDDWEPPEFGLLENLAKLKSEIYAERKLIAEFDARCHGHIFLLKEKCLPALENLAIEFLPVVVEGMAENFLFANVLAIVEAIDFHGLDFKQSMDMIKSNTARFLAENIKDHIIFRDQKLINTYFCTPAFMELINKNSIRGLRFEKAGETRS